MMADLTFEEECPCGATIKVTGYVSSGVRDYIATWHHTHNRHANTIAKTVAESKAHPVYLLNSEAQPGVTIKQE